MDKDDMEVVAARLPPKLVDSLEDYCNDLGIRKSEGVRRIVQDSLEDQGPPNVSLFAATFLIAGAGILLGVAIQRTEPGAAVLTGVAMLVFGVLAQAAVTARARADN